MFLLILLTVSLINLSGKEITDLPALSFLTNLISLLNVYCFLSSNLLCIVGIGFFFLFHFCSCVCTASTYCHRLVYQIGTSIYSHCSDVTVYSKGFRMNYSLLGYCYIGLHKLFTIMSPSKIKTLITTDLIIEHKAYQNKNKNCKISGLVLNFFFFTFLFQDPRVTQSRWSLNAVAITTYKKRRKQCIL